MSGIESDSVGTSQEPPIRVATKEATKDRKSKEKPQPQNITKMLEDYKSGARKLKEVQELATKQADSEAAGWEPEADQWTAGRNAAADGGAKE